MDGKSKHDKWSWKKSNDRSRRDEVHRHTSNQDSVVVLRQNKPDQRRREKMKKRWSVRPDVSLVGVPPGKQCHIIGAVVLIFLGLFLAVAGLVMMFILKHLTTHIWKIGIGILVLGIIVMIAGLIYLLRVCCFRTSTRYKQYVAQYKGCENIEINDVSRQVAEKNREESVASKTTLQTHVGNNSSALDGREKNIEGSDHPSEATSSAYFTPSEHTPSNRRSGNSSMQTRSNPQWTTPKGYRPLKMNELTEYGTDVKANGNTGDFDDSLNGHHQGNFMDASSPVPAEPRAQHSLKDDFDKLEEVLREMVMTKSADQETAHLMRGPVDTSTPMHQRVLTVPIVIEGDHRSTPPTPIPPSYDQVIKNYRTYSRSASPTRFMESDL